MPQRNFSPVCSTTRTRRTPKAIRRKFLKCAGSNSTERNISFRSSRGKTNDGRSAERKKSSASTPAAADAGHRASGRKNIGSQRQLGSGKPATKYSFSEENKSIRKT